MKRTCLFLALIFIMASCTKEYYTEPDTFTLECTIYPENWELMDTPPTPSDPAESSIYTYFFCDVDMPELTPYILEHGTTTAYLVYWDNSTKVLAPLPLDDFYMDNYMWTQQATCEFSPGSVRFIVKYSDFAMGVDPAEYSFKVKLMW